MTGPPSSDPAEFGVEFAALPGGSFRMGSDDPVRYDVDGEGPVRPVSLSPFSIATTAVTNGQFRQFVEATGFRTTADQVGWTFVFGGLLPDDFAPTQAVASAPWWRLVEAASWSHPEGPQSNVDGRLDHPVVHISWDDAQAYCQWSGTRLPTEAEWEFAARGGLDQRRFPWGDDRLVNGTHPCNVWQGSFPNHNTEDDGWYGTAPVRSFEPNGFGLWNTAGNVWEWCQDWFDVSASVGLGIDPAGPASGTRRVMRGGSYLCHESYCFRFRVSARSSNSPDSSTGNLGFRVVSAASLDRAREETPAG